MNSFEKKISYGALMDAGEPAYRLRFGRRQSMASRRTPVSRAAAAKVAAGRRNA